jgi:hypothetical protein
MRLKLYAALVVGVYSFQGEQYRVGKCGGVVLARRSGRWERALVFRGSPGKNGLLNNIGGTIAEGITRRITLIAWRDPGAKLVVHGEGAKEEA